MVYADEDASQSSTAGSEAILDAPEDISSVQPDLSDDFFTRVSRSRAGRKVLTALIGFLAVCIAVPNLPSGPFTDGVDILWKPVTEFGLRQNWHVFSPNPRAVSLESRAVIEHGDGSVEIWEVSDFDPALGSYREYRWRKWEEKISLDSYEERWEPFAEWLANNHVRNGELPETITLVERKRAHWSVANPEPIDGLWVERVYYTWERDG